MQGTAQGRTRSCSRDLRQAEPRTQACQREPCKPDQASEGRGCAAAFTRARASETTRLSQSLGGGVGCVRVSCVILSHNARHVPSTPCHVRHVSLCAMSCPDLWATGTEGDPVRLDGHVAADHASCHNGARNRQPRAPRMSDRPTCRQPWPRLCREAVARKQGSSRAPCFYITRRAPRLVSVAARQRVLCDARDSSARVSRDSLTAYTHVGESLSRLAPVRRMGRRLSGSVSWQRSAMHERVSFLGIAKVQSTKHAMHEWQASWTSAYAHAHARTPARQPARRAWDAERRARQRIQSAQA